MASGPQTPLEIFTNVLQEEWEEVDAESVADSIWLAQFLPAGQDSRRLQREKRDPGQKATVIGRSGQAPPPPAGPKAPLTSPQSRSKNDSAPAAPAGTQLPIQVPAAQALRSPLEFARALRPLMCKIPSPTQWVLDEEATAIQVLEQEILSPVLVPAPERRFDLALVVEAGASLMLWEETIQELVALVESQGAFRTCSTWRLEAKAGGAAVQLSPAWHDAASNRRQTKPKTVSDPTGRRIIWILSDFTSSLWDYQAIYQEIERWGRYSPVVLVQLLPERLWLQTALGLGQPLALGARGEALAQRVLTAPAREAMVKRWERVQERNQRKQEDQSPAEKPPEPKPPQPLVLPVMSLEPELVRRWARVTMGAPQVRVAAVQFDLAQFEQKKAPEPGTEPPQSTTVAEPSAAQRVQRFRLNASPLAQRLAGYLAAVPVSLPVTYLIQETLLPQSRQVQVAEVFMGGLLRRVKPEASGPPQYDFCEGVRDLLLEGVPISQTLRVLDAVSAYISQRLGLGQKSFGALVELAPRLADPKDRAAVQPFAEIAVSTLKRLGGNYRRQAEELEAYLSNMGSPPPSEEQWPTLKTGTVQVVTIALDPVEPFEFEWAQIVVTEETSNGVIQRNQGQGWQYREVLPEGIELEMVAIEGGTFWMGSPEDEPGHNSLGGEDPRHQVTLPDFYISKAPITQAQWQAVAQLPQQEQALNPDPANFKGADRPVEKVSWRDVMEFCLRLSALTQGEYSLPTEAEWEYAGRAGTETAYHCGAELRAELANYHRSNIRETSPVGQYPANPWGLVDIHGNVWEWCLDQYHGSYAKKPEVLKENGSIPWLDDGIDISLSSNARRTLRGGSWLNNPEDCRSAVRSDVAPGGRGSNGGFRVVCRRRGPRTQ